MKRLNVVLLGAMSTTLFCGCIDKDLYDPDYKKENFEAHWNKQFGDVDPNQDWNMATLLKANIDLSSYGGGAIAKIYTANPVSGGQLIGVASQSTTLAMNVVKGSKYVFATIEQNGSVLSNGYVPIQNGEIHIGGFSRSTREANDVTLGEKYVIEGTPEIPATPDSYERSYNTVSTDEYNLDIAKQYGDKEYLWLNRTETEHVVVNENYAYDQTIYIFEDIDGKSYRVTNEWTIEQETGFPYNSLHKNWPLILVPGTSGIPAGRSQTYQKLNNIETSRTQSWRVEDYFSIFGKDAPFEEQADPSTLSKYKDQFTPNVTFTVSGPLTLDYMFGGTQNQNVFGYYYWQDGEDPIAATRYVLINDARPSSNLTYATPDGETKWELVNEDPEEYGNVFHPSGTYTDQGPVGDMALATWMTQNQNAGALVTGTSYKVPYFDGSGNVSYDFPTGTHIAFFLVVNGLYSGMSEWLTKTNLSVQDHNLEIGRTFSGYNRNIWEPDATQGEIDAISFKSNGQIFLGFEDRGGDKDMNDIVFFVNGNVTSEGTIPDITPKKSYPQWIIACEDLGSTDDYDFNDCVFGVTHVAGTTEATVQALAAGGVYGIDVYYQSTLLFEIHQALGTSAKEEGSYPMLNTSGTVSPGSTVTITVPADFTLSYNSTNGDNMGGFSLQVHSKETTEIITSPKIGTAPQMLLLPGTWAWPKERIDIRDAYPNFENWNSDTDAIGWCDSPVTDKVVSW